MVAIESEHFTIHVAPEQKRDALQLKTMLEDRTLESANTIGLSFPDKSKFEVYLYSDQAAFQMRRWGMLALLSLKDQYVSDMRGTALLVVNPQRPGLFVSADEVLDQAVGRFISDMHLFMPIAIAQNSL
jgi:hypothetical protein